MYVSPKNIQLVAETNQALSHIMTLYLEEGDYVIAEEPVVPDNASIFRNKGINLVTVPMEPDGMDLAKLETAIRKYAPKFIYTMPNYHNPTGIVMSLEKRKSCWSWREGIVFPSSKRTPSGISLRRKPASQPVRSRSVPVGDLYRLLHADLSLWD